MFIVRELLRSCNKNTRSLGIVHRHAFDRNGLSLDPDVQWIRWLWFLLGCALGSLIMRCFSWFVEGIYTYSGDSKITLVLCISSSYGAFLYAHSMATPMDTDESSPMIKLLLWILYTIAASGAMRYYGPLQTANGLTFLFSLRRAYRANARFTRLTAKCKSRAVASRLRCDHEFAKETFDMIAEGPFISLGAALGGCLQVILPLRYTCSGILLFTGYRFILVKMGCN